MKHSAQLFQAKFIGKKTPIQFYPNQSTQQPNLLQIGTKGLSMSNEKTFDWKTQILQMNLSFRKNT